MSNAHPANIPHDCNKSNTTAESEPSEEIMNPNHNCPVELPPSDVLVSLCDDTHLTMWILIRWIPLDVEQLEVSAATSETLHFSISSVII